MARAGDAAGLLAEVDAGVPVDPTDAKGNTLLCSRRTTATSPWWCGWPSAAATWTG